MGSHYAPALSIEERRSTPTINLGGADGVYDGDRVPDILVEDYDTISSGAGDWSSLPQRPFLSAPYSQLEDNGWPDSPNSFRGSEETNPSSLPLATSYSQDNVWPDSSNPFRGSEEMKSSSLSPTTSNSQYYGWPNSSKSFGGSKDMYSSSSSPAASKLSPDTSFDFHGHFSSDRQSFNRGTERHSRSCPTSPTAVVSSGLSWLRIHASNEFIDNPSQPLPHTPSSSSSSASEMSTVSITDLLDNCAPIYQNSQPGTSSDSSSFYLSPPPFQRSPNSFRGSDEMNSSSSSLAAPSNIFSDASFDFDGSSFSDQQPFNLEIWKTSQSCPASITTFPASSSQFNLSRPETFVPERPFTDNYQPSPSSTPQTATGSNTVLLDDCAPIYPNIRAGASAGFPSFDLSPSSFEPNWSFPPRRIALRDQRTDFGQAHCSNHPMEPRPPDDFGINFLPFQAAETEVFSMRPSPQNLTTDGGGYAEESRGRRRRSESELYSRSDKVPVNTARNHPYPSRSRSRTPAECPGYRARVSTEASKRVSDARRTAPAPYQCHICSYTFTRADGLQNHLDRHNGKGKTTKCDFCHEEKTTISRHMKTCSMNPNRQPAKSNKK